MVVARSNPGYLAHASDMFTPEHAEDIPLGELRTALHLIASPGRGADPVPFTFIGQSVLVLGELELAGTDLESWAASNIDEVPGGLVYESAPGTLSGYLSVVPGGLIHSMLIEGPGQEHLEEDEAAYPSLVQLLRILRAEGAILPETSVTWTFAIKRGGLPRFRALGPARELFGS